MTPAFTLARWFLVGGAGLGVIGLVLWLVLPIQLGFPPFLFTALLSLIFGGICLARARRDRHSPP